MMDFITHWHSHCVVGVGKDSGHGTWLSLISFHGMVGFHGRNCILLLECECELWNMTIACALRWRVATIGIKPLWAVFNYNLACFN